MNRQAEVPNNPPARFQAGLPLILLLVGLAALGALHLTRPALAGPAHRDAGSLEASWMNLLANASFETDANSDGIPDGWSSVGLGPNDRMTNGTAHEGTFSFQMLGVQGGSKVLYQRVNLSGAAGERFVVRGWSKSQGATATGAYGLLLRIFYTDGTSSTNLVSFSSGTHNWQPVQRQAIASTDFNRVAVFVLYSNQAGAAWFDNLSLTQVAPTPT
ncbi:MAG: hypothetical protein ACRDIB_12230, partial [Ardenticatenaceae bacterium]